MARLNIIFDFGAVVFTWEPHSVVRKFFPEHASSDAQAKVLANSIFSHADWHDFDAGKVSVNDLIKQLHTRTALAQPTLHAMVAHIGPHLEPIPDAIAVLKQLCALRDAGQDIKLFYLSNMPEPYARTLEQRHAFIQWFDGGIFSGDHKIIKPDLAIFQLASRQFGIAGQDTVFIDDSLANIEAARAHGWRGVHLPQPQALRVKLFDAIGR
ncbi:MAG: HAD family phosphatase [Burkholderiaceae bacterium]